MPITNVRVCEYGISELCISLANFVPKSWYIRYIRKLLQLPSRTRSSLTKTVL